MTSRNLLEFHNLSKLRGFISSFAHYQNTATSQHSKHSFLCQSFVAWNLFLLELFRWEISPRWCENLINFPSSSKENVKLSWLFYGTKKRFLVLSQTIFCTDWLAPRPNSYKQLIDSAFHTQFSNIASFLPDTQFWRYFDRAKFFDGAGNRTLGLGKCHCSRSVPCSPPCTPVLVYACVGN